MKRQRSPHYFRDREHHAARLRVATVDDLAAITTALRWEAMTRPQHEQVMRALRTAVDRLSVPALTR
jgi:hypothetical protein